MKAGMMSCNAQSTCCEEAQRASTYLTEGLTEKHDSCCTLTAIPALANVGALCLLADRVQAQVS